MRRSTTSSATSLLLTTLCSLASPNSFAGDLPPELEGKVQALKKGERAKTDGILLTRDTLVLLLKESERRVRTAEATAEKTRRDAEARIAAAEARARTEVEVAEARAGAALADQLRRERIYEDAIRRAGESPPWWRSPLFVGTLGALVGGGLCVGAAAASR